MVRFRSLRSGSSGNLLLLESLQGRRRTRLLIDCGLRSQRACVQILEEEVGLSEGVDGLLVTHAHSDHVNYSTLRVMSRLGIPVYAHNQTSAEIAQRYLNPFRVPAGADLSGLELRRFDNRPFRIDGFRITPIPVPHAPHVTTHAFAIHHGSHRLLLASDFHDPESVIPHIYGCDLIYIEANHDLELLRRYFNPASLFHLPNPAAGLLLHHALQHSKAPPAFVVLAHLSEERNRPELALETVKQILSDSDMARDLELVAAPRYAPTRPLVLG